MTPAELRAGAADLPAHERDRLLMAATGWSRARLAAGADVPDDAAARFAKLVARRRSGEPLQYIEGTVRFGPLDLLCDRRALIPRPETEGLWELAVAVLPEDVSRPVIVDLGTGGGCLALALKHAVPAARVLATDVSAEALALARANVLRTGLEVTLLHGDLFQPLPAGVRGEVDLIVANPPYVAAGELDALPAEVRRWEPELALVAGPAGDEVLARIAVEAGRWLRPGGAVVCEIGEDQGERVRRRFAALGGEIRRDLAGRDRYVVGRRPR